MYKLLGAFAPLLVMAFLAGCSGGTGLSGSHINSTTKFSSAEYGVAASPRLFGYADVPKGGGRYQVGRPYQVAGRWYHPSEDPNYDEVGRASWYGPNFHGRLTANGEAFDQFHLSAAHPTLPLPSYVRVQNLANGRSVIVRVNDRGPFAHNRLIDLSRRAAEVLGFIQDGTAEVRVTYVGPAPLEGDDTNYLMASIQGVPAGGVQNSAPVDNSRRAGNPGGLLGGIVSLFSYADETASAPENSALAATYALEQITKAYEPTYPGQPVTIDIGQFASAEIALDIAREIAVYGAVDHSFVTENGQNQFAVRLVHLKPGVTRADIDMAKSLLGL